MRARAVVLLLAVFAAACGGGGGGDSAAFCETMERFVEIANNALSGEDVDFEALDAEIQTVISEAEANAPAEIADIIDSTDPADQDQITTFVTDECGVTLPDF